MPSFICPISSETIDKSAARLGAVVTAGLLVAYAFTGLLPILLVVVLDYVVRVFTRQRAPIAIGSNWARSAVGMTPKPMNKAPKIFAWRVGFIMAVATLVAFPASATASTVIAVALAGFNVLDGVGNFCVGCAIYTYLVLPRMGPATDTIGSPSAN